MIAHSPHYYPDPWLDGEWEAWETPATQPELGQIDNPYGLNGFLRDEEKARAKRETKPPGPLSKPSRLAHIPGYPG